MRGDYTLVCRFIRAMRPMSSDDRSAVARAVMRRANSREKLEAFVAQVEAWSAEDQDRAAAQQPEPQPEPVEFDIPVVPIAPVEPEPESWVQVETWITETAVSRIAQTHPELALLIADAMAGSETDIQRLGDLVSAEEANFAADVVVDVMNEVCRKYAGAQVLPA